MNAPMHPTHDCTADWPSDPDNEHLAQFARRFETELPAMSESALARVGQAMRQEMARAAVPSVPSRRPIPFLRIAVAAALLLGVGIYLIANRDRKRPENTAPVVVRETPSADTPVQDNFPVSSMYPTEGPLPERPILQIEDNQSLFQK